MRKALIVLIIVACAMPIFGASGLSPFRGVWANDNAESVITDSV